MECLQRRRINFRYTFSKRPHTINDIGDNIEENIDNNVLNIVLMRYSLILILEMTNNIFNSLQCSGNIVDRMGAIHATFIYDYYY